MKTFDSARTRLRLLLSRRAAESRMNKEFRFHIDMETDRLVRQEGLTAVEARRRALAAFGGVEKHKEALRDGRGLAWLRGWPLNLKLGLRMFARYPGVTIVGVAAMAIGIGIGAAYLEGVNDFLHPRLPFEDGDRIVGLQNWDASENDPELRSARDFVEWRDSLTSIQDLGAFRSIDRNVGPGDSPAEPAPGAEISASAFRITRVPALFGRTLIEADERDGAPCAVVLGHDLWHRRFVEDSNIVGRSIRLGDAPCTVVGVMPEGFAFPLSQQFWTPLSARALAHDRRQGPPIQIFGRLAAGVSLEEAQSELSAIGARTAVDFPGTHEHLRPRVVKYADLFVGHEDNWQMYLAEIFFGLLLLVLGSNVATMIFARTATREHEIAMRFALGASRGQILAQFFAEAAVLALAATVLALTAVAWGTPWFARFLWDVTEGEVPFWLEDRMNLSTLLYALALAGIVALVAGVMPALKATGTGARARLRHAGGSGGTTLRFGGIWSAVIVVQVVFTVLILPPAIVAISALGRPNHADPGFAAEQYLSARIELDGASAPVFRGVVAELKGRLLANPQISRVTFASRLPGMAHPEQWVDAAGEEGAPGAAGELATATSVDPDFFQAFGAALVAGRPFAAADAASAAKVVVVNEDFVADVLGGRNPIGRRMRYSNRYNERTATGEPRGLPHAEMLGPGTWFEIVGVVKNIGMDTTVDAFTDGKGPGVYHPLGEGVLGSGSAYGVRVAFHIRGEAVSFAKTFREITHAVDPALRVYDVLPLDRPVDRVSRTQRMIGRVSSWLTGLVGVIALLISVAGIYSVMSFTVARQTREIGIRLALGASSRSIVRGVFSRAMFLVGTGIVFGGALWFHALNQLGGTGRAGLLLMTAVLLFAVATVACGLPIRRALRIQPTEALRNVG